MSITLYLDLALTIGLNKKSETLDVLTPVYFMYLSRFETGQVTLPDLLITTSFPLRY